LQAAQSTYEVLLRRLQEVRVAENQNIGNVRILEAALVPQKPSAVKNYDSSLRASAGYPTCYSNCIHLEVSDTSKTLKEARELFGYIARKYSLLWEKVNSSS